MEADILSLSLIMFIAVTWMELFKSLRIYLQGMSPNISSRYVFDQARSHGGAFEGNATLNFFCAPRNFVAPKKNCFKTYSKGKNRSPLKMYCAPPNLETWLRACLW